MTDQWTPQRASRRIIERGKQARQAEAVTRPKWTESEIKGFLAAIAKRKEAETAVTVWMPVTTRRGVLVKTKRTIRARKTPVEMRDARH